MYSPAFADVPIVQSQADHVSASGNNSSNRQRPADSQNSELLESLLFQVQDLQSQVAEQRGIIEELSYQVQVLQEEQKERYIDLDRRILTLQEQASKNASQTHSSAATPDTEQQLAELTDEDILAEYNAAKGLMLDKKFDESIAQLAIFAKRHPDHQLTANAWYWIGEIYLVQHKNSDAKAAFERIVNDYPSHDKVPDSLYKLGVIAQQAADVDTATQYFQRVINEYPNTQSAKLSKARLQSN
ncbi:MAG: tol-pal system protein YbgF [Reinekea sp.]